MKVFTMYLPQFHRVKENDEWWGEGFTEWVAAKAAVPLFSGHEQPRRPLGENYYDLLDKATMVWQARLMQQFKVDGQCFYHYWFKDGRQILEKPAENLLKWKDISMPFFFCWANETWARTWSKINSKNVWASTFEQKQDEGDSGILLKQQYGDETRWKEHFDYLVPFFKDERYIKINNKPLFLIGRVDLIPCLEEMLDKWEQWAKEEGFYGLYAIGGNSKEAGEALDAILYQEPSHTISEFSTGKEDKEKVFVVDYDSIWEELLKFKANRSNVYYGGFVSYDDTPRRGKAGCVIANASPDKFKRYLTELMAKNTAQGSDIVFINAWNEWGEGMCLEPDERYGYGFLEAIPYAKSHYKEYMEKYDKAENSVDEDKQRLVSKLSEKVEKYKGYWGILDAWMCLKEEGRHLEEYFIKRNLYSIAVYGAGMLGRHLLKELENSSVKVEYIIDKLGDQVAAGYKAFFPEGELPEVDAVIVTAVHDYYNIFGYLRKKGCKNVISLEEVIMEMM